MRRQPGGTIRRRCPAHHAGDPIFAQLGYEIHEDTEAAIRKLAPTLQKISAERIQVELTKLLVSPHPDTLRETYDMGVTKVSYRNSMP